MLFSNHFQFLYIFLITCRCSWSYRRPNHRTATRKVSMRFGRILPNSISQPSNKIWKTSAQATVIENCFISSDRAAFLRSVGWQNSDRNSHQRHVAFGINLPVAHNGGTHGYPTLHGASLFHVKWNGPMFFPNCFDTLQKHSFQIIFSKTFSFIQMLQY
jgi:hypothetical protein